MLSCSLFEDNLVDVGHVLAAETFQDALHEGSLELEFGVDEVGDHVHAQDDGGGDGADTRHHILSVEGEVFSLVHEILSHTNLLLGAGDVHIWDVWDYSLCVLLNCVCYVLDFLFHFH